MKAFLLIFLSVLIINTASGQVSFSSIKSNLKIVKNKDFVEVFCASRDMNLKFRLKRNVNISPNNNNVIMIDGQIIQISPLKIDNYNKDIDKQNTQKVFLEKYSEYEMEYFKSLGLKLINHSNQWVLSKSRGWFIWYFRVADIPGYAQQAKTQLFATTVIGKNVLTINAAVLADNDFKKAATIMNEMMEALVVVK